MMVFSVIGYKNSGKTATVVKLIEAFKHRNYRVGTIKNIHCEDFAMDQQDTDTSKHQRAGADIVAARGRTETDIMIQKQLGIDEIIKLYDVDVIIIEGAKSYKIPHIVTASSVEEMDALINDQTLFVSGVVANDMDVYKEKLVLNPFKDMEKMVAILMASYGSAVYAQIV